MRRVTALIAVAALAALLPTLPAHAGTDYVELRTLQLVNGGRPQARVPLVMHAGLRAKAQAHSAHQSQIGSLTHDGFSTRVSTADPDPYEANGAPDDGFGAACENVAYFYPGSSGATDDQVAQKFYDLWYNSSGHRDCMFDAWGYNLSVAGMGVYQAANGYWWATFISVRDLTPPQATTEPLPTAPSWHRSEQSNSAIVYTGVWSSLSASRASGGSYGSSKTPGGSASFTFDGTGVRWVGLKSKLGGIAEVRLDGAVVARVDQYRRRVAYKQTLFERTGLGPGEHTLEVIVTGLRNKRARDTKAFVDAFDYYGP